MTDRFTRYLVEGVVQAALLYTPQLRPGLIVEPAIDDELILVASYPDATVDLKKEYVAVDWGPEFTHALTVSLPHLTDSGRSMALGSLAAEYIVNRHAAAYLPARSVKRYLDAGNLYLVADAPRFPYPSWVVWRDDLDEDIMDVARTTLSTVVQSAEIEQETVTSDLKAIEDYKPVHLGTLTNE
jgi:DNA-binding transcriptional LysR family regulator